MIKSRSTALTTSSQSRFLTERKTALVVFNLSRTTALPVTFSGANAPSGTVQVGRLTSANITDTNEVSSTVVTTNSTINNLNPATGVTLPPFSMTVYTWTPGSAPTPAAKHNHYVDGFANLSHNWPDSNPVGDSCGNQWLLHPTGNVTFDDGGSSLGTTALTSGKVTLNVSTLAAGTHSITAIYAGNSNDNSSTSTPVTVTVTAPAAVSTTTTLSAPSSVTQGQTLTLTATVKAASGNTPTGTVNFKAGSATIGSATLSGGTATYSGTVSLATGQYAVVASYAGNSSDNASSSAASTLTVNQSVSTTTTSLTAPASVTQGNTLHPDRERQGGLRQHAHGYGQLQGRQHHPWNGKPEWWHRNFHQHGFAGDRAVRGRCQLCRHEHR